MKLHPQTIYHNKQAEFVVLPIKEYRRLINALEDHQDIQEIRAYENKPNETFPMEIVTALARGKNAIKIYREYRKISQSALADKVNVSKQYISQLEKGDRAGTTRVLKSIANALRVDLDDIIKQK